MRVRSTRRREYVHEFVTFVLSREVRPNGDDTNDVRGAGEPGVRKVESFWHLVPGSLIIAH